MPDENCVLVRERLRKLIARGTRVADMTSKTSGERIIIWMEEAERCLEDGGAVVEKQLLAFRTARESCVFKVKEESLNYKISETENRIRQDFDLGPLSGSAYRPTETDELLDFRFERLQEATAALRAADKILKGSGSSSGSAPNLTLGERLRAAREQAGHSQREAAQKIGYDHKYISEWETGKTTPSLKAAKNIRDYIKNAVP